MSSSMQQRHQPQGASPRFTSRRPDASAFRLIVLVAVTITSTIVRAQDAESPSRNIEKQNAKASDKKSKSKLDDDLLNELIGDNTVANKKSKNPVEKLIRSMRDVQSKIEQENTGEDTQKKQEDIVSQLDKLIEAAKQSMQSQSNQQNQSRRNQPANSKKKQQQDQDSQTGQSPGKASKKQPKDSETRVGKADEKAIREAKQKVLMQEVWGHLPPNLRKKLLNVFSEKRLLKYDELVRRYFESLTETSDR